MTLARPFIFRLAVFAITLLVFARLTTCSFTWWDDQATIRLNPRLNPPIWNTLAYYWTTAGETETMGLYVPVTYTLWAGLAKIARLDHPDAEGLTLNPIVFHSANVLLHALTAVVVFQLLLRLFGHTLAAFCGSLLFALHPVQVESVAWISGTKDLLCGLLSVTSLLFYVRSIQIRSEIPKGWWHYRWRYLLALLFFIIAMLAKPTAIVVPLMAAVLAIFFCNRTLKKTMFSLSPWFLLMIRFITWTQKYQPAPWADPLPVWARPAVALDAIAFYFYKLVWPIHLCIDYGHNPVHIAANHTIYFTWIVPVIVAGLLWWRYPKSRPVAAIASLFLMPLLPVLGLVPFEFQLTSTTADHYLYLPMLGIGALLAWAIIRFKLPIATVLILLFVLAIRSILQEPVWQNSRTLFKHTLDVNPGSVQACDNLGFGAWWDANQLAGANQGTEARPFYEESISWYLQSLQKAPTNVPSMRNLAADYEKIDRHDLAVEQLRRIVEVQPQIPPGLRVDPIRLAHLLNDFEDWADEISVLDQILQHDPGNFPAMKMRERAEGKLKTPATHKAIP